MRAIFVLLIVAAIFHNGIAVRCFQCVASLTSDCFDGVPSAMIPVNCALASTRGSARSPFQYSLEEVPIVDECVTMVHTVVGMTFIERGCGFIYEGVDICEYMTEEQGLVFQHCSSCTTDLCNTDVPDI